MVKPRIQLPSSLRSTVFVFIVGSIVILTIGTWAYRVYHMLTNQVTVLQSEKQNQEKQILAITKELEVLKGEDQYKKNQELNAKNKAIESAYTKTVAAYERLLDLKTVSKNTKKFDDAFSHILLLLSQRNYATASSELVTLADGMQKEQATIASAFTIPANVPTNNTPPGSGFSRQQVATDIGNYLVDIISADLGSTRVIVDTATDGDCRNDCPVLSLGDYVGRNGAFAGVNGSYFCPADYPSCADKKNSFDTLAMNKNKKYINSDNNVYSTVPAVIFLNGSIRFVGQSLEWGRDTGVDGVLANQPLLLSGGNIVFGGDGDPKKGSKGSRSFVGNKGNTVYIGVVHNVTVAEAAHVLKSMGLDNALNLDSGGSTALWSGGYKVGPGRNIPNAIVFVRK